MVTLEQHISRQKLSSYLGGDSSTPFGLVQEMVDKLPQGILQDPNSKFLDPAAGTGTYIIVLFYELKKYHSEEHILNNMLYVCETNRFKLRMLKNLGIKNIYEGSFLEYDFKDMKFDVIIGNPPYNKPRKGDGKRRSGSDNLWGEFVNTGIELVKEGGYFSLIHPCSWTTLSKEGGKADYMGNIMSKYKTHYINLYECGKYFNVGSDFSYYTLEKTLNNPNFSTEYIFQNKNTTFTGSIKLWERRYLPKLVTPEILEIFDKTVNSNLPKFEFNISSTHISNKDKVNKEQTEEYNIPIHNGKAILYSNTPHNSHGIPKVVIPLSCHYKDLQYTTYGVCQNSGYILASNEEEGKNLYNNLNNPIYKFITKLTFWSGWNSKPILRSLPYLDPSKSWSEDEIYNYLGLVEYKEFIAEYLDT